MVDASQWKCRVCGYNRFYRVVVQRGSKPPYTTSFHACSQCSVMFEVPARFNAHSTAAPDVKPSQVFRIAKRSG